MKKTKCCVQKHNKITTFQNHRGHLPRLPPPQMTSLLVGVSDGCVGGGGGGGGNGGGVWGWVGGRGGDDDDLVQC